MVLNTTGIIWAVETNYFEDISQAKDKANRLSIRDNSDYGVFQSVVFGHYVAIELKKFESEDSPLLKTIYNKINVEVCK